MELLPHAARAAKGEVLNMLHLGSTDGVDPLSLAEVIEGGVGTEAGSSSYAGKLKLTLSDNYGNGAGQNSVAEAIVTANIERRQLSEVARVMTIPPVNNKRSIDLVRLPLAQTNPTTW